MSVLVLVVDDEPDMEVLFRQQFRRELRSGRFGMAFAPCADDALGLIARSGGREIILLLSDVNMPGMSGLELLARVKTEYPSIPVVMVTAYGDLETRRQALASGAEDLIAKPIDFQALKVEVDRRLSGQETSL